jgi:hypothetical protein
MKKIYTLALIVASSGAFAQNMMPIKGTSVITKTIDFPRSAQTAAAQIDTLGLAEFAPTGQVINYGFQGGGGYIFGTNASSFVQQGTTIWQTGTGVARGFVLPSPTQVTGALLLVGKKYQTSPSNNSKVVAKVTTIASKKALGTNQSTAADTIGPNSTALATGELTLANVDTSASFVFIPFTSPANVTNDFAITLDYTSLLINKDSISILADANGNGNNLGYTWGKLSFFVGTISGTPNQSLWAFTKLGQTYPNPTVYMAKVEVELENASKNVTLKVIDLKGRILMTNELGTLSAGKHSFDLNVNGLASGNYLYMLSADGHNLVKQMSIVK